MQANRVASVLLVLTALAVHLVCFGCSKSPDPPQSSLAAAAAFVFDLSGAKVDALATGRASIVVFVFISTHCPISNRYAPTLEALQSRYAGEVEFVAVYPDPAETAADIVAHHEAFGLHLAALRDPDHALVRLVDARVTPEVAVFGRADGGTTLAYSGRIDDRALEFGSFRQTATEHDLTEAIDRVRSGDVRLTRTAAVGCYIADLR